MKILREIRDSEPINNATDVYNYLAEFKNQDREMLIVIGLDSKNCPVYREIVHIGTLNSVPVHPREVFKKAVMMSCASLIIAHNHPSGKLIPSREDIDLTAAIRDAGQLLGIELVDHIIIGDGYKSIIGEVRTND